MKIILIFLFLASFILPAFGKTLLGRVQGIHDGDTLTFFQEGSHKKMKLRLLGVDTPEVDFNGQTQGEAARLAKDYLAQLLPINAQITIELPENAMDSNDRYLGQVFYQGMDLNLEMLKKGLGAVYFIYPYDKKLVVAYMRAAKEASDKKLGIYSDAYENLPLPYVFRQEVKGVPGTNLVANFETKKLYSGEDLEMVPHYHRVFFSSEETALIHGFNW